MAQADLALTTNSAITVSDIDTTVNCEPRVHDLRLADALGFTNRHIIRTLIRRHLDALQTFGEITVAQKGSGSRGGRPGTDYYLNKRQALYITAKSDTERAALVTVEMVEVFDQVTSGAPTALAQAGPITAPEKPALPPVATKPRPRHADLFAWSCVTLTKWQEHGFVNDPDAALRIIHRAMLDVAGDDFVSPSPGRRRRS